MFSSTKDEGREAVEMIRTVAAGLSRKRDSIYLLLTKIYQIGRNWLKRHKVEEIRRSVIRSSKRTDRRVTKSIFRLLVEQGCPGVDIKLRSRYANALRYAYVHDCAAADLVEFLKSRGGIEKCAKRFSALRRERLLAKARLKRRTTW